MNKIERRIGICTEVKDERISLGMCTREENDIKQLSERNTFTTLTLLSTHSYHEEHDIKQLSEKNTCTTLTLLSTHSYHKEHKHIQPPKGSAVRSAQGPDKGT